ncbi:Hsp20/alpha crystallin family protein [bacterium]|nr:Hsp20/alpha crystallin family protein [bacterium]
MKFLTVRQSIDPMAVLRQRMHEHLSRLLDSAIESRALDQRWAHQFPLINLFESADAFHVIAEVPGVQAEDLDIDVSEESLVLQCRRPLEPGASEESFRRQERWHGVSRRELNFSKRVKPEEVSADLHAGVLSIRIPKAEPPKRHRVDVQIKTKEPDHD